MSRALLCVPLALAACAPEPPPEPVLLSVWEPTPDSAVERMLALADLQPGETLLDLGSGDGRIVVEAARRGARAVGYEIDDELIAQSRRRIAEAGVGERARIEDRDLLTADFASADVVAIYLTPESFPPLIPLLEDQLQPGARVVAYKFPLPGWTPEDSKRWQDPDPDIPPHEVFLYRR